MNRLSKALVRIALLASVIGVAAALLVSFFLPAAVLADRSITWVTNQLYDVAPLPEEIAASAERSVVYATDGSVLATLHGVENRVLVDYDEIPQVLLDAVIATEDQTFYEHKGVNYKAIVRAALTNLRSGGVEGGGSTITQQLVKNVVIGIANADKTLDRKLTEAVYAVELEKRWDKQQIITAYLNELYLGEGVYGVGTAAEFYFGKHVSELTLPQAAMFAGMIRSPERNNPVDDPVAARTRRNIVLDQMASVGTITAEQAATAKLSPLAVDLHPLPAPSEPFYVEWVKQVLFNDVRLGETREQRVNLVLRGGLRIHTTLDPKLQGLAEAALAEWLTDPLSDPMGALVSVTPSTGAVVAMAVGPHTFGQCSEAEIAELGGCDKTKVNPVVPGGGGSGRQVGSSFKPIVAATAIERGTPPTWSTETRSKQRIPGCNNGLKGWYPTNYNGGGGGYHDMYWAMQKSSNVYHAKLAGMHGANRIAEMSVRLGITVPRMHELAALSDKKAENYCAISLGAVDAFPIQMVSAFATFANQGTRCAPYTVTVVRNRSGNEMFSNSPDCQGVVDPGVAAHVTKLLEGPPAPGGTAPVAALGRPVAGKTGTTNDWRDAWFVGYVPQLATAAWVGFEQPKEMLGLTLGGTYWKSITGGSVPARMWKAFMEPAVADLEVATFEEPPPVPKATVPNVVGLDVEEATRMLAVAELAAEATEVTSWQPAGQVVSQDLEPGVQVPYGVAVALEVSDGTGAVPTVPDVVGQTQADAVALLEGEGWVVNVVSVDVTDPTKDGVVVRQFPENGTEHPPVDGAEVTIHVGHYTSPEPDPSESPGGGDDPGGDTGGGDSGGGDSGSGDGDGGDDSGSGDGGLLDQLPGIG